MPEAAKLAIREAQLKGPRLDGGYMVVNVGHDHPASNRAGCAPVHRLMAAEMFGMGVLPEEWCVHHEDEDKTNNEPSNLRVFASNSLHAHWHALLRRHRQTHCLHGHEYTADNTRIETRTRPTIHTARVCRACEREKQRRHNPRRRARRAAARMAPTTLRRTV